MPLSEHEQKLLEQMEQALITEDPRFASNFRESIKNVNLKKGTGNLGLAILGLVAGLGGLLVGVSTQLPLVGVIGFVLMVLSVSSAVSAGKSSAAKPGNSAPKVRKSFMQNLEERWDNRSNS